MKKVYANYCMLETLYFDDEATEEVIIEGIREAYASRGVDFDCFDDGEYEIINSTE